MMNDKDTMPRLAVDWKKVRIYMALRGINTEGELTKIAGLNRETVVQLKKGESCFESKTVSRLAVALGCNPLDLLRTEGFPDPHMVAPAVGALS